MNTQTYTSLLAAPQQLTKEAITHLVEVIDAYPYFQSARALWLKGLKNEDSFRYNDSLKVTAAHTTNRDILFEFITSESFDQHQISQQILSNDATIGDYDIEIAEDLSHTISQEQAQETEEELKKAEAILNPNLFEKKIEGVKHMIATSEALSKKEITSEKDSGATPTESNKQAANISESIKKSPSEILEIDTPLSFSKQDSHSFSEWLQLTTATPIVREVVKDPTLEIAQKEKEHKYQLIEKFINEKPKIKPASNKTPQKNLAIDYTKSSDSLMTETLAKVYLQQKNYKKAIQAYKILILKNPEKSGFFADQIRAVKKLINIEES
ncbi:MAG: tetratricopeptide (TPR) repeat protein [Patiriisocius sp.]